MVNYLKTTITNPNITVGDFTYYDGDDFEKHVTHHYDFIGDKLIISKFCQIAKGIEFIMNDANHQMNAISTYPFFIFGNWQQSPPPKDVMPYKSNTIVSNDVWIGQNVKFSLVYMLVMVPLLDVTALLVAMLNHIQSLLAILYMLSEKGLMIN